MAPGKTGVRAKVRRGSAHGARTPTLGQVRRKAQGRATPLTPAAESWYTQISAARAMLLHRAEVAVMQRRFSENAPLAMEPQAPRARPSDQAARRVANSQDFDPIQAITHALGIRGFAPADALRLAQAHFLARTPVVESNAEIDIDAPAERVGNTSNYPHWQSLARALGLQDDAFAGFDTSTTHASAHEISPEGLEGYRARNKPCDHHDDTRELRELSSAALDFLATHLNDAGTVDAMASVPWASFDFATYLPEELRQHPVLRGRVMEYAERIRTEIHEQLLNPVLIATEAGYNTTAVAGKILTEDAAALDDIRAVLTELLQNDDVFTIDPNPAAAHAIIANALFVALADAAIIDRGTSLSATVRTLWESAQQMEAYRGRLTVGFAVALTALGAAIHDFVHVERATDDGYILTERGDASLLVTQRDVLARFEEIRSMFATIANLYREHGQAAADTLAKTVGRIDLLLAHFGIGLTKPAGVSSEPLSYAELGMLLAHPYRVAAPPAVILQGLSQIRDAKSPVHTDLAPQDLLINLAWRHPLIDDAGIAEYREHAERALREYFAAQQHIGQEENAVARDKVKNEYKDAIFAGRLPEEISADELSAWIAAARDTPRTTTDRRSTSPRPERP